MSFNESNTVEQMILDAVENLGRTIAVDRQVATFRVADLQAECLGVGLDLIRRILARLQKEKKIKSLGTGRGAKWQKIGN